MFAGISHADAQVTASLVQIKSACLEDGPFAPVEFGEVDEVAEELDEIPLEQDEFLQGGDLGVFLFEGQVLPNQVGDWKFDSGPEETTQIIEFEFK